MTTKSSTEILKQQAGVGQPAPTPENQIQIMLKAEVPRIQRLFQDPKMTGRFVQLAMNDMRKVPKLFNCHPQSVLGCLMQAASLGLYFGMNGQCFMVPYGTEATFVTGWRGHVTLALRGNLGSEIGTGAVRDGDEFDYSDGSKPFIHHKAKGDRDAPIVHFWGKSLQPGARHIIPDVWSSKDISNHRDRFNKVGTKHYSYANPESWEAYGRKIPLLQVIKYLPICYESAIAQQLDFAADKGLQKIRPETVENGEIGSLPEPPQEPRKNSVTSINPDAEPEYPDASNDGPRDYGFRGE
jgi:recombination protein RecT